MNKKITLLFLLTFSNLVLAQSLSGGSSDGGGSSCTRSELNKGRSVILDLALSDPTIIDPIEFGSKIQPTDIVNLISYDKWIPTTNSSFQLALSRVREWGRDQGSQKSMDLLRKGILSINFLITRLQIQKLSRVFLPEGSLCQMSDLKTVALYKQGFVNISIPAWNMLGLNSQIALIIHEGLRNIQISQRLEGSDLDLEKITSIILGASSKQVQLDDFSFFAKYTHMTTTSSKEACGAIEKFYNQYPARATSESAQHISSICKYDLTLESPVQISAVVDNIRTAEQDLSAISHDSNDIQELIALNNAYNPMDLLMSQVLHRLATLDDYLFRNATIKFNGEVSNIDLKIIKRIIHKNDVSSEVYATARKNYRDYLEGY